MQYDLEHLHEIDITQLNQSSRRKLDNFWGTQKKSSIMKLKVKIEWFSRVQKWRKK